MAVSCIALAILALVLPLRVSAGGEQKFDSPEQAVAALTEAANAKDTNAMRAVFGPEGHELMSPDVVQASEGFTLFTKRLGEKVEMAHLSDSKIVLDIGSEGWPFAIPLVKQDSKWFFDVAAGKEEILNRRIGSDELRRPSRSARLMCRRSCRFAARDRNDDGVLEYAQHLRSTSSPASTTASIGPAKKSDSR